MQPAAAGGAAATRYERRLAAEAAAGNSLAAALEPAARAARAAVAVRDAHAAALRDVAAGVAAPALIAFVAWVLDDARARGIGRLHFLARDGQVLHALAGALGTRLAPGIDARYLAASRQTWARAISASANHHWLWYGGRAGITLPGVLRRLAVPADAVAADLKARGLDPTEPVPLGPGALARLRDYLQGPDFATAAAPARAANRRRLLAYLAQEGVRDPGPAAIVDLGWSGSLHDALCDLLAAQGEGPVDCYLFGIERVTDTTWLDRRHGFVFDHNRGTGADPLARPQDRRGLLEVFCAADHGTVTGLVEAADGRIAAQVDESWAGPVAAWGLATVRATLQAVAKDVAARLDPAAAGAAGEAALALRPALADTLRAFWLAPDPAEARAWGAFPFNLGEGHGSYMASLAEPYGPADLRRALQGAKVLKKHEHFWVEGALAMTPGPLRAPLAAARRLRRGARA